MENENSTEAEKTAYQQEKNKDIDHVLDQSNFGKFNKKQGFINDNRIKKLASIREKVENMDKEF